MKKDMAMVFATIQTIKLREIQCTIFKIAIGLKRRREMSKEPISITCDDWEEIKSLARYYGVDVVVDILCSDQMNEELEQEGK